MIARREHRRWAAGEAFDAFAAARALIDAHGPSLALRAIASALQSLKHDPIATPAQLRETARAVLDAVRITENH